jgi:hypothetical protein
MLRIWRVALSAMLIACVGSSAFANCLPGDPKPAMEMACCQTGHDCGPAMQADCCTSSRTPADSLAAVKPTSPIKPVPALSFLAAPAVALAVCVGSPIAGQFPIASSPPSYLITASLRI